MTNVHVRRSMSDLRTRKPSKQFFRVIGYAPYPFQEAIHNSPALYRVPIIGRQSGKSEVASAEAAFELCCVPKSSGWIVAPTYEQASIIFQRTYQKVLLAVQRLPHLKITTYSRRDMKLEVTHYDLNTGQVLGVSHFAGKSGDKPDNLRGASLTYCIIDEAAMIPEEVWTAALSPTLSTTNGWVMMITTPKGYNWVYKWFIEGQDPSNPRYESWQIPSWIANPTVPLEFYEEQKRVNPDLVYRQEYGAEFISDAGSVFVGVDECPTVPVTQNRPIPGGVSLTAALRNAGHGYVIGADFARLNDFSVFTVADLHTGEIVRQERCNTVAWAVQLANLKELSREYGQALVVADVTGLGDPIVEQLSSMGVPVEAVRFSSLQIKEALISKLALAVQYQKIKLLDDEETRKEFRSFVYTRTETGQLRMGAAGAGHDDRVIATALAWSKVATDFVMPRANPQPSTHYFDRMQVDMDSTNKLLD